MELNEAKKIARALVRPTKSERVWLEQALGRILAENLYADWDLPRESRASVDGFAIATSDINTGANDGSFVFRLHEGVLAAGDTTKYELAPGECLRIFTGAPLPENADAVVAQEETAREDGTIVLKRPLLPGEGVLSSGGDIHKNSLLLPKGTILTPTRLALIAALGYATVSVHLQPKVALLTTGDELREIGEPLQGPYSYCNNRYLMAWSASLIGGKPIHLGISTDDPELIAEQLEDVEADVVISTGGVGHGDRDFVLTAWRLLGVNILFEEVNLIPGRRTALGMGAKQVYLGLPGSPWGAQIAFEQLAVPILLTYQGLDASASPCVPAMLETTIRKPKGFNKVVRGTLQQDSSKLSFRPVKKNKQSIFAELHNSLSYILLESHISELSAGSDVLVRFHDFPLLAFPPFGIEGAREGYYA